MPNRDQWNRIGNSEINPCILVQLIFHKGTMNTQQRKDSTLINVVGKTGYPYAKE